MQGMIKMTVFEELKAEIDAMFEKTSKKEEHRIQNFKKRHNYDDKTKTIETDIKDKNGKNQRVKFDITNGPKNSEAISGPANPEDRKSVNDFTIHMPRKALKEKPMVSSSAFKHEEGHIAQHLDPTLYKNIKDEIQNIVNTKSKTMVLSDHGKDISEYIADIYSSEHSGYGVTGLKKMCDNMTEIAVSVRHLVNEIYDAYIKTFHQRPTETELDELLEAERSYKLQLEKLESRLMIVTQMHETIKDPEKRNQLRNLSSDITNAINDGKHKIAKLYELLKSAKADFKKKLRAGEYKNYIHPDYIQSQRNEAALRKEIVSKYSNAATSNKHK